MYSLPVRAGLLLLSWIALACEEPRLVAPVETDHLFFMLLLSPSGAAVGEPEGPWPASEIPRRWSVEPDQSLILIGINPEGLGERYPSFDRARASSLALVRAPDDLAACVDEGLIDETQRVVVPLEGVSDAVVVLGLGPEDSAFTDRAMPAGYALQFDGLVCNRAHRPVLVPFGDEEDPGSSQDTKAIGAVEMAELIDADTLLLFGIRGLARVRLGSSSSQAETFEFGSLIASAGGELRSTTGAITVRDEEARRVELVAAIVRMNPPSTEEALGIARFTTTGTRAFELIAYDELTTGPVDAEWLHQIHVESDGRYIGIGSDWIVTATSAAARPRLLALPPGFGGRWILRQPEGVSPHLVLGTQTVFEGDAFAGVPASAQLPSYVQNGVVEAISGSFMPDGSGYPIVGFDEGRLRLRNAEREWVEYPFTLPPEAKACSGAANFCGRYRTVQATHVILGSRRLGGLVLGASYCSAFFFRALTDSCSSSFTTSDYRATSLARDGISAVVEDDGQTLVVTAAREVYRLEHLVE